MIHELIHIIVLIPLGFFFVKRGHSLKKVVLMLTISLLVDIDHLLADPIYDPSRCSINFHPLHSYWAIGVYGIGLLSKITRISSSGLLSHMLVDWLDCLY